MELLNTRTQAKHYDENIRRELLKVSFQHLDEDTPSKRKNELPFEEDNNT